MLAGLALSGAGAWLSNHRFAIATWLVITTGADIFVLLFILSFREARASEPRVRLREWIELPMPGPTPSPAATDSITELNRRLAAAGASAGSVLLAGTFRAYRTVRAIRPLRARHTVAIATSALYAAAMQPAARAIAKRLGPAGLRHGNVIDIQALLSAQSVGWFGAMTPEPEKSSLARDAAEERADRLAS